MIVVSASAVDQPLSQLLVNRLTRIAPYLADILDFDRVCGHLIRNKVLNWTQYQALTARKVTYDRNVQLIDNLQRGSLRSIMDAKKALEDVGCKDLGRYLLKGNYYPVNVTVCMGRGSLG